MDEKELIRSQNDNLLSVLQKTFIAGVGMIAFEVLLYIFNAFECRKYESYGWRGTTKTYTRNFIEATFSNPLMTLLLCMGLLILIITGIYYLIIKNTSLVVTNFRVYGVTALGMRVDIPIDSISSVALWSSSHMIAVGSSSGRIMFSTISNADKIHEVISQLLIDRQYR